jgi:ribosomal protein RSM22 (predicted rRNA methylase)
MLQLPPDYTRALEEVLGFSLTGLSGKAGKKKLDAIVRGVMSLTQGLTKERAEFVRSEYLRNEEQLQAYLLYYTSTNLLKLWPPLRELARDGFFERRTSISHLDLGSGTGAAVWGLATYLKNEQPNVTLKTLSTDKLPQNLKVIERFAKAMNAPIATSVLDLTSLPNGRAWIPASAGMTTFDLVTLMNVLAEIGESHDENIISFLKERSSDGSAIVMIEPANRELSRRALRFRDRMVAAGFFVYAPCCRTGGCPALMDEDNWCHTEIPWARPDFIRAIDDEVATLRLSLKATYAVFLKQDRNLTDTFQTERDFYTPLRVVSERFDEKGRQRFFGCNDRGRQEYVMNKRDRSDGNKGVKNIQRYDLVRAQGVEVRANDVKIGESASVDILSGAEGSTNVDNSRRK